MYDLHTVERATRETLERAAAAYIECAIWASTDDSGEPLEADADDLAPEALESLTEDVHNFLSVCWGDTWEGFSIPLGDIAPEQIGHDLWLTRNGHGAGFWDRGLGEIGERLSEQARAMGSADLYRGDDGLIYVA